MARSRFPPNGCRIERRYLQLLGCYFVVYIDRIFKIIFQAYFFKLEIDCRVYSIPSPARSFHCLNDWSTILSRRDSFCKIYRLASSMRPVSMHSCMELMHLKINAGSFVPAMLFKLKYSNWYGLNLFFLFLQLRVQIFKQRDVSNFSPVGLRYNALE
jgi:hypothetical protein